MVNKKTFCVRDFFTTSLRVVCIFETCCKILSINNLQRSSPAPAQIVDSQRLIKEILKQKLNEAKRSGLFAIRIFPICY